MGSFNRVRGGANANAFGKLFEKLFLSTCRSQGIAVTQIPDGCKQVGGGGLLRVKTPWDFVLTYRATTGFIDTKTTQEANFPCSQIVEHQILELDSHARAGAVGGYVIWLRKTDRVFFMPAFNLIKLMHRGGTFNETYAESIFLGTSSFDVRAIFKDITLCDSNGFTLNG